MWYYLVWWAAPQAGPLACQAFKDLAECCHTIILKIHQKMVVRGYHQLSYQWWSSGDQRLTQAQGLLLLLQALLCSTMLQVSGLHDGNSWENW
jgi:hypothetical protein